MRKRIVVFALLMILPCTAFAQGYELRNGWYGGDRWENGVNVSALERAVEKARREAEERERRQREAEEAARRQREAREAEARARNQRYLELQRRNADIARRNAEIERRNEEIEAENRAIRERQREEERIRREEERRREEARIHAVGEAYVRRTAAKYNQLKENARWEATMGKEIVRNQTAMENYFTPGTRVIERDTSSMDMQPVTTTTDKSSFAAKLKDKKRQLANKESDFDGFEDGFFTNRTFHSLSSDAYSSSDLQYFHEHQRLMMQFCSSLMTKSVSPSRVKQVESPLYLQESNKQWDLSLLDETLETMGYISEGFIKDSGKHLIEERLEESYSPIGILANKGLNIYKKAKDAIDVYKVEEGIINKSLTAIKKTVSTGDPRYVDDAFAYAFRQTGGLAADKVGIETYFDEQNTKGTFAKWWTKSLFHNKEENE